MEWKVKNMESSTARTIKRKAHDSGMEIAEYLEHTFGEAPVKFGRRVPTFTVRNIKPDTVYRLKNLAAKRGERIGDTLEYLIDKASGETDEEVRELLRQALNKL